MEFPGGCDPPEAGQTVNLSKGPDPNSPVVLEKTPGGKVRVACAAKRPPTPNEQQCSYSTQVTVNPKRQNHPYLGGVSVTVPPVFTLQGVQLGAKGTSKHNVVSDAEMSSFFESEARRHSQLMLLTKVGKPTIIKAGIVCSTFISNSLQQAGCTDAVTWKPSTTVFVKAGKTWGVTLPSTPPTLGRPLPLLQTI